VSSVKDQISKSVNDIYLIVNDLVSENKLTREKIINIEKGTENIQATLEKNYITADKHALLQAEVQRQGKILYFAISIFAGAVILAIANLIIRKP
jgi:hypothetical protein